MESLEEKKGAFFILAECIAFKWDNKLDLGAVLTGAGTVGTCTWGVRATISLDQDQATQLEAPDEANGGRVLRPWEREGGTGKPGLHSLLMDIWEDLEAAPPPPTARDMDEQTTPPDRERGRRPRSPLGWLLVCLLHLASRTRRAKK